VADVLADNPASRAAEDVADEQDIHGDGKLLEEGLRD
jgi:hypothetical protein